MTIRLESRHVKREFPEGAVQVVAKKLRRSLCNTKGAPEMTKLEKPPLDLESLQAVCDAATPAPWETCDEETGGPKSENFAMVWQGRREDAEFIVTARSAMPDLLAREREAKERDGKARDTIARQDGLIRRLHKDIAELEARNDVAITNMLKWQQQCEIQTRVAARVFAERDQARCLMATFVNNDPNDDAADGVTVYAVWKKDAERFLRGPHVA